MSTATPAVPAATVDQYRTQGWCVIRNLLPVEVVHAVRDRVAALVAQPRVEWPLRHFQFLDPAKYHHPGGELLVGSFQLPAKQDATFAAMAHHPHLAAAMAALLGGPVKLFTDQVGVKHGFLREEQGGRSYYHQDSYYWKIAPELGCNCWFPLHEAGADAIALAVQPGSQQGWTLLPHESYYDDPAYGYVKEGVFTPFMRHRIPAAQATTIGEVLVPMAPGDGLFFTNYTWHRSEPNRTGTTRAFYAIAYQRQ